MRAPRSISTDTVPRLEFREGGPRAGPLGDGAGHTRRRPRCVLELLASGLGFLEVEVEEGLDGGAQVLILTHRRQLLEQGLQQLCGKGTEARLQFGR